MSTVKVVTVLQHFAKSAGDGADLDAVKPNLPPVIDITGDESLGGQDSFYSASAGQDAANAPRQNAANVAAQDTANASGQSAADASGQNHERPWDSNCPEPFLWDGRSSLMVCVNPDKKTWYQANVVKQKSDEYLLSWPGESPATYELCMPHCMMCSTFA